MATAHPAPDPDPIAQEGRRLLEEDPELRADLDDFGARLARDEVAESELHPHSEVLRRLGVILTAGECAPE